MQTLIDAIVKKYLNNPKYECGYACVKGLLSAEYSQYSHGISIVRKLDDAILDAIADGPTSQYFEHYKAVNAELNSLVRKLSDELAVLGIANKPIPATVEDSELDESYQKTLTYKFSHKPVATRAGLGWIGKTDLLITKRFGPRVRLASILVDYPLPLKNNPIDKSLCGHCTICVDNCPGHAANGKLWDVSIYRNDFFDPFKCREFCRTISKKLLNENISLCGKCVYLCPHGKNIQGMESSL